MAGKVDPKDLVGAYEIAERLGVNPQLIRDWRRRYSAFPKPVSELRMGLVWSWSEVKAWADRSGRPGPRS